MIFNSKINILFGRYSKRETDCYFPCFVINNNLYNLRNFKIIHCQYQAFIQEENTEILYVDFRYYCIKKRGCIAESETTTLT